MKRFTTLVILITASVLGAFAQSAASSASNSTSASSSSSNSTSSSSSNSGSSSSSDSTSKGGNAQANGGSSKATLNNTGENVNTPRPFTEATAGPVGSSGVMLGIPTIRKNWAPLPRDVTRECFTIQQIESLKRQYRGDGVKPTILVGAITLLHANSEPVCRVYDPPTPNQIAGRVTVERCTDNLEDCLALAYDRDHKEIHAKKVYILFGDDDEQNAHGHSFGLGVSSSGITNNQAAGISGSGGAFIGTNRFRMDGRINLQIVCLNDEPPSSPVTQTPPQPPGSLSTTVTPAAPTPTPTAPPAEPTPTPEQPVAQNQPPPPPPVETQPAQPITPEVRYENPCGKMTELAIYFPENGSEVNQAYDGWLKQGLGAWLAAHPNCVIQIEGHSCLSGGELLDVDIAWRRAENTYKRIQQLIPSMLPQIVQYVSVGKEKPVYTELTPDKQRWNRRVVFRVVDPDSSMQKNPHLPPGVNSGPVPRPRPRATTPAQKPKAGSPGSTR